MKLLLAEDTKDLSRAVCAVLAHEGYEVDAAYDGDAALDMIENGDYDAILLDIMMPGQDGLSVLKTIREENILTPVLLLTAKAEIDDRVKGLDLGADDYLTKPFAMKELLARIRSLTRRRRQYEDADLRFGDLSLLAGTFELSCENTVRLSIKEFELLQILIKNSELELDTDYLLRHVWKNETDAGSDTVWLYISYLNGKLEAVSSRIRIDGVRGGQFRLKDGEQTS